MLPAAAKMFALVRDLSARREVTEIAVSRWLVQRHNLAAATAVAGVSSLRDELAVATMKWLGISRQLPQLVARLRDARIDVAPIKGVAYATSLYPSPAERPMTDIDLLVRPRDDRRARQLLEAAGFRLASAAPLHHATTWERGDLTIDLHRDIMPLGRGQVALAEVWDRARPGWPDGASRLEPVDELVFHLLHMVRNRLCGPLIQVLDASRLLEHATGASALARARDWKLEPAVRAALAYCHAVLGELPLPRIAPSENDIVLAVQPSAVRKVIFDLATVSDIRQLLARALGSGISSIVQLRSLRSRSGARTSR